MADSEIVALDASIAKALDGYLMSVAVPICVLGSNDSVKQIGTGTFFRAGDRIFLVTAAHVVAGEKLSDLVVPKTYKAHASLMRLGPYQLVRSADSDHLDIAVLRLTASEALATFADGWQVLTAEDVGNVDGGCGLFAIAGYPSSLVMHKGYDHSSVLVRFVTQQLREIPQDASKPVVAGLDLFLGKSKVARGIDGTLVELVRFQGVSGAPVFTILKSQDGSIWTPRSAMKLVGVQSSEKHEEFLRVKAWSLARHIISNFFDVP